MTKQEKVIKGLEMSYMYSNVDEDNTLVPQQLVLDALALLKAQEAVEERLNLCESCTKEYAECEADESDLVYGSGIGHDNIIGCPWYTNRWAVKWE